MRKIILCLLIPSIVIAQAPKYIVDSASVEHAGVPKGEVLKFSLQDSKIFPGTTRDYWIYIPAQYDPSTPACVYINQDGISWKAPTVFDNLIFKKEMPITIGVFVSPGRLIADSTIPALTRYNRSYEYDAVGSNYARFLLEELLPDVEKKKATNGRVINLSKKGNDRAIGGASSGAVCAFTAAWEYPNEFSRVFSAIGTYIGLRGADEYPVLIRKNEPKRLRIFLQDGTNDLNIYAGDWWKANEMMERALTFAGYEVNHVWGADQHNGNHGTSIFPDAMRWLWKDWPKAISKGNSKNQFLSDLLIAGEDWELVGEGYKFTEGTTTNAAGEVFFQDIPNAKTYKIGIDNKLIALPLDSKKASGTAFGPDGKKYVVATATNQVISYDANGKETVLADSIPGNDLIVARNGNIYVTAPEWNNKPGKLYLIRPNGEKIVVDERLKTPNGVALTPDQTQVYITESATHWVTIEKILPDGKLTYKERYGWLHSTDAEDNAWSDGIRCDTAGRVFVATRPGIQIMDQMGRVNAILHVPTGQPSNCCFGGKNFDVLYVTSSDKVYRRKLKTRGNNSFDSPMKPVAPRM